MFGSTRIKIDDALMAKVKKYAEAAGYSSAEEFVLYAIEHALASLEEADPEEEVVKRLRGMGYIN